MAGAVRALCSEGGTGGGKDGEQGENAGEIHSNSGCEELKVGF